MEGVQKFVNCYSQHPPLKLGKGELVGSSASNPNVADADVYISLNYGSTSGYATDPWDKAEKPIIEVHFQITDGGVPKNVKRFKKMVKWICNQLQEGKKVHVGCIGGHGRTGMVLSAVVAKMLGEPNAIQYVRKHYCKKAVENSEQVSFLMKHYGVTKVKGAKPKHVPAALPFGSGGWGDGLPAYSKPSYTPYTTDYKPTGSTVHTIYPVAREAKSLWYEPKD